MAYWQFESGAEYDDTLGNFPLDPNVTAPTFATGLNGSGQAIVFDGDDDYAQAENLDENWFAGYSVSLWVKTTEPNQPQYSSVFHMNPGWQFDINGNLPVSDYRYRDNGNINMSAVPTDSAEWTHLAMICDGTTTTVYRDGKEIDSVEFVEPIIDRMTFGRNRGMASDYSFKGTVDEVKVWNYGVGEDVIGDEYYNVTGEPACIDPVLIELDDTGSSRCKVDLADFAVMAAGWLDCGLYPSCP
jgi:hypothetical protein